MQTKNDVGALKTQTKQAPRNKIKLKVAEEPSEHDSVAKSTVISAAKPKRTRIRRPKSRIKTKKEKEAGLQAMEKSTLDSALKSTSARAKRLSETERKAELAKAIKTTLVRKHAPLEGKVRKVNAKESGVARKMNGVESDVVRTIKRVSSPKRKDPASTISEAPGFDSLKGSLVRGSTKTRNNIEKADVTELEILREIAIDIFVTNANYFQPLPLNRLRYQSYRMASREFYSSELSRVTSTDIY